MRALKTKITASLIACALGLGVAASPAEAGPHWGHYRHGGYWGPAAAIGLFGAAIIGAEIASRNCVVYRPVYDQWGNYLGRRAFNTCY